MIFRKQSESEADAAQPARYPGTPDALDGSTIVVEMETAALFAVAKFRNVKLGQILYGGDDLSAVTWDSRKWHHRTEIRENLVDISIRICLSL